MSWVGRLRRWAPVRAVHVERVAFDTHAMSAGRPLEGVEYQQGTLAGYEVREYLLAKWGRTCAYCGKQDAPLNLDHIHPRSRGGCDRISNLTLACIPCNQTKNATPIEEFLKTNPALLAKILKQAKAPLRDAAAVNATRWALWRALEATGLPVATSSGGRTKWNRTRTGAAKSHTLDALHVGHLDAVTAWPSVVLVVKATGRGTYCRTRTDKYGFPRLRLPRTKTVRGFQTGDLVRANVPTGKRPGFTPAGPPSAPPEASTSPPGTAPCRAPATATSACSRERTATATRPTRKRGTVPRFLPALKDRVSTLEVTDEPV